MNVMTVPNTTTQHQVNVRISLQLLLHSECIRKATIVLQVALFSTEPKFATFALDQQQLNVSYARTVII